MSMDELARAPMSKRDRTELRRARAYLLAVAEPPARELVQFVAANGPVAAADAVLRGQAPHAVGKETSARRESVNADRFLDDAELSGTRLVIPEDAEWPAWPLLSLEVANARGVKTAVPPLGLWVRGNKPLTQITESAIAVVGARAATAYGEHTAAELAHGLAAHGVAVFSGAAYGIDGAAHRGALAAAGDTVAVLGCGFDAGYPAGHVGLLERIADNGAVISEYPARTAPARHRFLVRNRLIAALTAGTVVVEAGTRSGAKNTASTAGILGKVVMAVPGPISSAMSRGCHEMIREANATLVSSLTDVTETVGLGADLFPAKPTRRRTDSLDAEALRVHEALLPRTSRQLETIVAESGVQQERVRAILPQLEIDGFSERHEDGWLRKS